MYEWSCNLFLQTTLAFSHTNFIKIYWTTSTNSCIYILACVYYLFITVFIYFLKPSAWKLKNM